MVKSIHTAQIEWNHLGLPVAHQFDDVYFSNNNGLEETRYVFLTQNKLIQRWQQHKWQRFVIAESGFGSGLNFLATWQLFDQIDHTIAPYYLHFITFEKYPLKKGDLKQTLSHWPELNHYSEKLLESYPDIFHPGCQRLEFADGRITLDIWFGDIHESLNHLHTTEQGLVDCWFLDGFAPSKNPQMWSQELFNSMARLSRQQATFATFTAAGFVRRGLQQAGFDVQKVAGFGRKREMICGQLSATIPSSSHTAPWYDRPLGQPTKSVAIIGAGIAGASVSLALSKRGIKHTLFEQATQSAQAASGNRQGAIYPLLNDSQSPLSDFFIAAFCYNRHLINQLVQAGYTIHHDWCGVLQLGYNERSSKRLLKLANAKWPDKLATWVNQSQASEIAGLPLEHDGLFYPLGGWATPSDIVQAMLTASEKTGFLTSHYGYHLINWKQDNEGFELQFKGHPPQAFSHLIVCNGYEASSFDATQNLPITPVRGQVTHLSSNSNISKLHPVLCYKGYMTPPLNGSHCIGATHQRAQYHCTLEAQDTQNNIESLQQCISQPWTLNLNADESVGRASVRAVVRDHLPLVGPLPHISKLIEQYPQINTPKLQQSAPPLPMIKGAYILAGLGSRGVTSAPLLGEIIASEIANTPQPVSQPILDALHPGRFWIRRLLRGQPIAK